MKTEVFSDLLKAQDEYLITNEIKDIHFRIEKLRKLKQSIQKNEADIYASLKKDLVKSDFEIATNEIGLVNRELSMHISNLKKWSR